MIKNIKNIKNKKSNFFSKYKLFNKNIKKILINTNKQSNNTNNKKNSIKINQKQK